MQIQKKQRNNTIDMLRGLSILVMIYIHTSTWYTSTSAFMLWSWDLTHFAVPAFVFCSAYLFFLKDRLPSSFGSFLGYIWKRLKRLIIPFYIFFAILLVILFFLKPETISWKYIYSTMLLLGGRDESWLVLLFTYLMILLPIIGYLYHKARWLFILYGVVALTSSISLLFYPYEGNYRLFMWIPWSVIAYFAWALAKGPKKSIFYVLVTIIFGSIFASLYFYFVSIDQSTILTKHKYPPNIFYLSFGMMVITALFGLLERFPLRESLVEKSIQFFSLHSYSIFFIHTLVIVVLNLTIKPQNIAFIWYFLIVLVASVLIQLGMNWGKNFYSNSIVTT
jgi:peptidoglycan/LPS O-acetylase OafA/YrhL